MNVTYQLDPTPEQLPPLADQVKHFGYFLARRARVAEACLHLAGFPTPIPMVIRNPFPGGIEYVRVRRNAKGQYHASFKITDAPAEEWCPPVAPPPSLRQLAYLDALGHRTARRPADLPDDELRPAARSLAPGLDPAAVQLDEPLHQRQPDPQPALRLRQRPVHLREHVEDALQLVGGDADAGVRGSSRSSETSSTPR